jgi:hypothetical protein
MFLKNNKGTMSFQNKHKTPKKAISFFATGFNLETPKKQKKILGDRFLSDDEHRPKKMPGKCFFDDCWLSLKNLRNLRSSRRRKKAQEKEKQDIFELKIKKTFFEDFVSEKGRT